MLIAMTLAALIAVASIAPLAQNIWTHGEPDDNSMCCIMVTAVLGDPPTVRQSSVCFFRNRTDSILPSIQGGNPGSRRDNPININHYATKKSVAESMLDVALFMANVTQLKAVLEQGPSFQYYATLAALISISLFFQVVIGILLIIMGKIDSELCSLLLSAETRVMTGGVGSILSS